MAFDIKEFFLAVIAVVIGAYILGYLGILSHSSPASARAGLGSLGRGKGVGATGRGEYSRSVGVPRGMETRGPIMVPRGASVAGTRIMNNVGPTEPLRANMSRQIGGRPFVL